MDFANQSVNLSPFGRRLPPRWCARRKLSAYCKVKVLAG